MYVQGESGAHVLIGLQPNTAGNRTKLKKKSLSLSLLLVVAVVQFLVLHSVALWSSKKKKASRDCSTWCTMCRMSRKQEKRLSKTRIRDNILGECKGDMLELELSESRAGL